MHPTKLQDFRYMNVKNRKEKKLSGKLMGSLFLLVDTYDPPVTDWGTHPISP